MSEGGFISIALLSIIWIAGPLHRIALYLKSISCDFAYLRTKVEDKRP